MKGMILGAAISALILTAIAMAAPDGNSPQATDQITGRVTTDKTNYKPGEKVSVTFIVENKGQQPVTLRFSSGQRFDIWVRNNAGELWRWSRGRMFTQALGFVTLKPGERQTYKATWNQRNNKGTQVAAGSYSVLAQLTTMGQKPTPVKSSFTIGTTKTR